MHHIYILSNYIYILFKIFIYIYIDSSWYIHSISFYFEPLPVAPPFANQPAAFLSWKSPPSPYTWQLGTLKLEENTQRRACGRRPAGHWKYRLQWSPRTCVLVEFFLRVFELNFTYFTEPMVFSSGHEQKLCVSMAVINPPMREGDWERFQEWKNRLSILFFIDSIPSSLLGKLMQ